MESYYRERLSAERLKRCYDIAGPRVKEYLQAEIEFVVDRISPNSTVLELGCGYGRILPNLANKAGLVVGIDNSMESLTFGEKIIRNSAGKMESKLSKPLSSAPAAFLKGDFDLRNILFAAMNAIQLGFRDSTFDHVICIQNGISAFHVNQRNLIVESLRVTRPGGTVLFSSYSEKFWSYRLEWFERQAEEGLLGEIDYERTGDGEIVCKDGFTATTNDRTAFSELTEGLKAKIEVKEVNESSIFWVITPN